MSYEILKRIKVTPDNKIMIKSCSNNVRPRTPHEWECSSLSKILQERGQEALDVEIMENYESGNFQGSPNKYTRALKVLRHMPEYKEFDWRVDWDNTRNTRETRKGEYRALLLRALKTRLPSDKFVIMKPRYEAEPVYYNSRKNARFCKWYEDKARATLFSFLEDALSTIKNYTNNDNWYVVKV